ncbi:hypothetical protein N7530_005305 [Penicillium desertorum]|uniref:Uncharacterized protein n=1 Tax=Penicillium desertorum TaxID=1303715 RepID=A0A9X0BRP7_9EURO|nr:hypothetical protein N7530_005305 [Penicillium desertorum]
MPLKSANLRTMHFVATGWQVFYWVSRLSIINLNRLRQFLYLPYYKHTAFAKEHGESYTMGHAEHCINYLRHSIQCPADLTPMLWQKKDNSSQALQEVTSLALDMETMYTCRKWGPIHGASSRQVNYAEREDLVQGEASSRFWIDQLRKRIGKHFQFHKSPKPFIQSFCPCPNVGLFSSDSCDSRS